jgi:hypothetical protein
MYKLSGQLDLDIFQNLKLEQVAVSENTITLAFERDIQISILGVYSIVRAQSNRRVAIEVPRVSRLLLSLVGSIVVCAEIESSRNLVLRFANDTVLCVIDDSDCFESYSIRVGKKEIFV